MLIEMCELERARLTEMRGRYTDGSLAHWLDLDIAQLEERLAWFQRELPVD
jgi:hypothetical protein